MKIFKFLLAVLAFGAFAACSDTDDTIENGNRQLIIDDALLSQSFDADRLSEKTVSFTALDTWTAAVDEVRAQPAWIELSKYSGEAGEASFTIRIIEENPTADARRARVVIACGGSEVAIAVEQRGRSNGGGQEPAVSKMVDRIEYSYENKAYDREPWRIVQKYEYDAQKRVERIVLKNTNNYDTGVTSTTTDTYTFDYSSEGTVTMILKTLMEGYPETDRFKAVVHLDDAGRMISAEEYSRPMGTTEAYTLVGKNTYEYDTDGRLKKVIERYSSMGSGPELDTSEKIEFYYTDGLLTRYGWYDSYDGSSHSYDMPADEFYPHRYTNDKANLDLTMTIIGGSADFDDDISAVFSTLRMAGSFGTCLMEKASFGMEEESELGVAGYSKPGVTIHRTGTEIRAVEQDFLDIAFRFDADGAVSEFSFESPYEEYRIEYDVVVSNQVVDPSMDDPNYSGDKFYQYEIKNRTEQKVRDIANPTRFRISYL